MEHSAGSEAEVRAVEALLETLGDLFADPASDSRALPSPTRIMPLHQPAGEPATLQEVLSALGYLIAWQGRRSRTAAASGEGAALDVLQNITQDWLAGRLTGRAPVGVGEPPGTVAAPTRERRKASGRGRVVPAQEDGSKPRRLQDVSDYLSRAAGHVRRLSTRKRAEPPSSDSGSEGAEPWPFG